MRNFWTSINPFTNNNVENKWLYLIKVVLKFGVIYVANIFATGILLLIIHLVGGYDIFYGEFVEAESLELIVYYGHIVSIVLTLLFVSKIDKQPPSSLGLKKRDVWKFSLGILYAFIAVLIVIGVLIACKQYHFLGLNPNRNIKKVFISLGAFIIYGLAEELLCRGLIENRLKERFNIHICVIVSFVVFCIPHLIELFTYQPKYSAVAIINLLCISYIFSLLLDVYNNVYVCIGFHTTWNVLFYSVIGSNINGSTSESSIFSFSANNSLLNGGEYGIEYGLITSVILVVFAIILSFVLRVAHKHQHSKLLLVPKKQEKSAKTDL